jgi:hypothetical protein
MLKKNTTEQESSERVTLTPAEQAKQVMAFVESDSPDFLASAVIEATDKAAAELGVGIRNEDGDFTEESLTRLFERTRHYNP